MVNRVFAKVYQYLGSSKQGGQDETALSALLTVYEQRPDLRESFPEVEAGDCSRLFQWASGVTKKQWSDAAYDSLREFGEWYSAQAFSPKHAVAPSTAFKTWDRRDEPLVDVERRIHDGVPIEHLHDRAHGYVNVMASNFPWAMPRQHAVILEIGSGVGYIMEAVSKQFHPSRIIGLDVAPAMIEKARERLTRDKVGIPAEFLGYDGITIPVPSQSVDFIYSVASLQHVPKAYVYNLFGEMLRIIKPSGAVVLHFLSFAVLKLQKGKFDLKVEVAQQLSGAEGHWHHFYSREELLQVLVHGYDASNVSIVEAREALWVAFTNATKA